MVHISENKYLRIVKYRFLTTSIRTFYIVKNNAKELSFENMCVRTQMKPLVLGNNYPNLILFLLTQQLEKLDFRFGLLKREHKKNHGKKLKGEK